MRNVGQIGVVRLLRHDFGLTVQEVTNSQQLFLTQLDDIICVDTTCFDGKPGTMTIKDSTFDLTIDVDTTLGG